MEPNHKAMFVLVAGVLIAMVVASLSQKSSLRHETVDPVVADDSAISTTVISFADDDSSTEAEKFEGRAARGNDSSEELGTDQSVVVSDQYSAESSENSSVRLSDHQSGPKPKSASGPDLSLYTPGVAEMLDRSMPKRLQDGYDSDERAESWAASMEIQLHAYLVQRLAGSQFNIARVDCRTYWCEIHLLSYGSDAAAIWNSTARDLVNQPWHDFDRHFTSIQDVQLGVIGIAYILAVDKY